jgi:hypothetical protein
MANEEERETKDTRRRDEARPLEADVDSIKTVDERLSSFGRRANKIEFHDTLLSCIKALTAGPRSHDGRALGNLPKGKASCW